MTDLSNGLSQMTSGAKRHRHSTNEYRLYLTLIFLVALPGCVLVWAYRIARHGTTPKQGPIQTALSEARSIAPCIFWG